MKPKIFLIFIFTLSKTSSLEDSGVLNVADYSEFITIEPMKYFEGSGDEGSAAGLPCSEKNGSSTAEPDSEEASGLPTSVRPDTTTTGLEVRNSKFYPAE